MTLLSRQNSLCFLYVPINSVQEALNGCVKNNFTARIRRSNDCSWVALKVAFLLTQRASCIFLEGLDAD